MKRTTRPRVKPTLDSILCRRHLLVTSNRERRCRRVSRQRDHPPRRRKRLTAVIVASTAVGGLAQTPAPMAHAAPAPEVEYTYDVVVRRHYDFPNNDAIGYGYAICNKVLSGESYPQVMGEVKGEVAPNDEFAANYLVSNAVGILCPAQIWQLRNSAARYQPPPG